MYKITTVVKPYTSNFIGPTAIFIQYDEGVNRMEGAFWIIYNQVLFIGKFLEIFS